MIQNYNLLCTQDSMLQNTSQSSVLTECGLIIIIIIINKNAFLIVKNIYVFVHIL